MPEQPRSRRRTQNRCRRAVHRQDRSGLPRLLPPRRVEQLRGTSGTLGRATKGEVVSVSVPLAEVPYEGS